MRKYDALGQKRYVLLTPVDLLPALVVLRRPWSSARTTRFAGTCTRRMPGR